MGRKPIFAMLGVALLSLAACDAVGPMPAASPPLLRDKAAIETLKAGGYVVYLRHGHTDPGKDSNFDRLDDCATQRNLSARGQEESRMAGAAIKRAAIPVTSVAASPFCRTRATAQLVLGSAPVEAKLTSYTDMPAAQRDASNEFVRRQFATPVAAGANVFLVGHSPPFDAATQQLQPPEFKDKAFLNEGDAAVIRADGRGGYALIGHIGVKSWSQIP